MQGLAAGTGSRHWVSVQATASRSPGNNLWGSWPRSSLFPAVAGRLRSNTGLCARRQETAYDRQALKCWDPHQTPPSQPVLPSTW